MSQNSRTSSINVTYSEWDNEGIEEIRMTLEQLRDLPGSSISRSLSNIEDNLIQKHKKALREQEVRRRSQKSLDLQQFKFKPEISQMSKKISEPQFQSEMRKMAEKIKAQKHPPQIEIYRRPSETISAPDPTFVKTLFNKRANEKPEKKAIHKSSQSLSAMGIVQKTEFFARKRQEKIVKASIETEAQLKQNCTFKPNLNKSCERKNGVSEMMTEVCITEEKGKSGEPLRPPAPNPRVKKLKVSQSMERKCYTKVSPDDQVYAFTEGINLKKLLEKSKPMLKYKIANNPY